MINELRTAKDGTQYFRAMYWTKEDAHFEEFGKDLEQIISGELSRKKSRDLISKVMPDLISWIWSDYAQISKKYFYCNNPYDRYEEEFGFSGLELADYFESAQDYFRSYVGIPMWAEMSIEYIDTSDAYHDRRIEDIWGQGHFLNSEGSSLAMIYASENSLEGELEYNKKLNPVDKFIIQDDPNWYRDQRTYYNWLDFDVTVDLKEIEREQGLIGSSYKLMTEEGRKQVILAALDAMNIKELEEQKVPQYLLTLLKSHPATPAESIAQIVDLSDENIIEIRD